MFQQIRKRIQRYVTLDGFAKKTKSGFYEVVSLYYDSPTFYYYHEKIDGARNRKKVRLRVYRADDTYVGNIFLEIKRKSDTVILKDRVLIDKSEYNTFMQTGSLHSSLGNTSNQMQQVLDEYEIEKHQRSLQPKVLVSYKREPYIGRYNTNFRVTFDYAIRGGESRDLFSQDSAKEVLRDGVVMEVKFNGKLPYYIKEIIDEYNLERVAYSKYCNVAEACYLIPGLSLSRNYFFTNEFNALTQPYGSII